MRRLNSQPPAPFSAEADIAIFQEAFGDIEKLEERWLRFEMTTD
jgi:hypothetical protein